MIRAQLTVDGCLRWCRRFVLTAIVCMGFCSCDRWVYVQYVVVNMSDSTIVVKSRTIDTQPKADTLNIDTVRAGSEKLIYVREIISNTVFDPDYGNDSLLFFSGLELHRSDDTMLKIACLKNSTWVYKTVSDNQARKELRVRQEDVMP